MPFAKVLARTWRPATLVLSGELEHQDMSDEEQQVNGVGGSIQEAGMEMEMEEEGGEEKEEKEERHGKMRESFGDSELSSSEEGQSLLWGPKPCPNPDCQQPLTLKPNQVPCILKLISTTPLEFKPQRPVISHQPQTHGSTSSEN